VVEEVAGPKGPQVASVLDNPEYSMPISSDQPEKETLSAKVFKTQLIESIASLHQSPAYGLWWRSLQKEAQIRSAILIPLTNRQNQPVGVIALAGHYPNQFESFPMQQFARGLRQRWEQIWSLCNEPSEVLDLERSSEYRNELFNGGLLMVMQPVVDLESGHMVAVEALARLKRPDGSVIPPQIFLPLLGDSELDRLFRMALDQSLEWLARWKTQGLTPEVSVNLPPSTLLDPACPRWIADALGRYSIPPSRLTLEILENQTITRPDQDLALRTLVGLGVKIAMDDLGSGYSSLQRLSVFPFDKLKVDQGILSKIRLYPIETLGVIGAIIQIGRELGRIVVVEGLEDEGMVEAAAILGARYGQGYALARPMPADQIGSWTNTTLPYRKDGPIRTYLGALAFHWHYMHRDRLESHPYSLPGCPMTRFLDGLESGSQDPDRWHRDIHDAGRGMASSSEKLTLWMIERVSQG
jgi:EAL domain-containing protein (putative c-di-GMP-specific phosphodiesterase class I)